MMVAAEFAGNSRYVQYRARGTRGALTYLSPEFVDGGLSAMIHGSL